MRLRQIALVARDLEKNAADLTAVLGLSIAYRDPGVGRFGLANIVAPIGNDFIEIVAPIAEGTAGGRYLDRRGGDGGYMVILQGDDAEADCERIEEMGVRVVERISRPTYVANHYHPADTGGVLLSIDSVPGGHWRVPDCDWAPAGPEWRAHRRGEIATALVGAELQSDDPEACAELWSRLLDVPLGLGRVIRLANATLRFVPVTDGRGRGLGGIDVAVTEQGRAIDEARRRGLPVSGDTVTICGTRVNLV